jgi:hypothetical protein
MTTPRELSTKLTALEKVLNDKGVDVSRERLFELESSMHERNKAVAEHLNSYFFATLFLMVGADPLVVTAVYMLCRAVLFDDSEFGASRVGALFDSVYDASSETVLLGKAKQIDEHNAFDGDAFKVTLNEAVDANNARANHLLSLIATSYTCFMIYLAATTPMLDLFTSLLPKGMDPTIIRGLDFQVSTVLGSFAGFFASQAADALGITQTATPAPAPNM